MEMTEGRSVYEPYENKNTQQTEHDEYLEEYRTRTGESRLDRYHRLKDFEQKKGNADVHEQNLNGYTYQGYVAANNIQPWSYNNVNEDAERKKKGFAIASLVLSIIGLELVFLPIINVIINVLAIIFAAVSMKKGTQNNGIAVAGLVIGIIGACISIFVTLAWVVVFSIASEMQAF